MDHSNQSAKSIHFSVSNSPTLASNSVSIPNTDSNEHLLQEIRIDSILNRLQIKSQSARDLFKTQCDKWDTDTKSLRAKSEAWSRLKKMPSLESTKWEQHLKPLLDNEQTLRDIDPATASKSQMEDWSQILFTGEFSSMNFVPFALMYIAFSKIILAPLIAWSMPLMTLILPYMALRFIYGIPITWTAYWQTMKPMIFGSGGKPLSIGSLLQWGSMLVSYGHGIYIPYTSAKHCYNIDHLMLKGSKAVTDTIRRLNTIADIWVSWGLRRPWKFTDPSHYGDERQVLAWIVEDKNLLVSLYRAIGQVEITAAIRNDPSLVPVEWMESDENLCKMVNAVDPLLDSSKRVPFQLVMGPSEHQCSESTHCYYPECSKAPCGLTPQSGKHHVICTGPNRGGKSTFLRTVLTNLTFAQGWGVAFAERCILTPVHWIISSLRLEDCPGKESLFEREVNVAGEIIKRVDLGTKLKGWVLIDELFHTTNPPDAAIASQIFLEQLWKSKNISSIVSTHLFSHAKHAPGNVQKLCVDTSQKGDKLEYTYKIVKGVNTMSSVKELLLETGILKTGAGSWETKTSMGDIEDDK